MAPNDLRLIDILRWFYSLSNRLKSTYMYKSTTKFLFFVGFSVLVFALIFGIELSTVKAQDMNVEHSSEFGFIDDDINASPNYVIKGMKQHS